MKPMGWKDARVGDLCDQDRKIVDPSSDLARTLPYISLEDIESGTGRILREPNGHANAAGVSTTFAFDTRHVLYGKLRPYLNKVAVPEFTGRCTTELIPLLPKQGVCREFVALLLRRPETVAAAMQEKTGSRMPRANVDHLMNLRVRVPPEEIEQRRIAAEIREKFERIDQARAAAAAQLEAAKALPAAYLREAFQGVTPLSADLRPRSAPPRGWAWHLLSTVAKLESGHTPSRYHPEYWKGQIPWIALPDIRAMDGRVAYDTQEHVNAEGIANSSARILPADTVVLSRTASVGFVTIMGRPMATSQDFVNWVCGPELFSPFLAFLLRAARDRFRGLASGAIHKTVYMPTVKALRICMPGIETQREIAAHLEVKLRGSDGLLADVQDVSSEFSAMPAAVLNQCFEGKN